MEQEKSSLNIHQAAFIPWGLQQEPRGQDSIHNESKHTNTQQSIDLQKTKHPTSEYIPLSLWTTHPHIMLAEREEWEIKQQGG